jgi:Ras-related C3 botulinum toxin substrate 1
MPQIPVLLCGTKIDLREDKNVLERLNDKGKQLVTKEEGEYMAEQCGCIGYIENSSLTRQNLKETFDAVLCCGAAYTVDSKQYNNAVGVKEKKKQSCRSQ